MTVDEAARSSRPAWVPWAVGAVAVLVGVVILIAVVSLTLQRGQTGVLDGVAVDGVDVGGASRAELAQVVAGRAESRRGEPVVIEGEREEVTSTRGEVGADFAEDATIDEAWSRGRRGLIASLRDHLEARRGARVDIPLTEERDEEAVRTFALDAAEQISVPARDASVEIVAEGDGAAVEVTESAPGEQVDGEALADELASALAETSGGVRVQAPGEPVDPAVTDEELADVRADAEQAVSGPVVLRNPGDGDDVELSPAALAEVLAVRIDAEAEPAERAQLVADPEALDTQIDRSAVEVEATEATFAIEGSSVVIAGGDVGFTVDVESSAPRVVEAALSEEREAELAGEVTEPERSRAEAEELGIAEEVASFTTEHAPGEPRVQNIQRFADLIEGSIIAPGESFSLNETAGPRTEERGFVADGVIIDGQLEESVGGGVSQYATTFFNTAWFAGIQIDQHQPHSFYISRYPEGREATLAYGAIDVVVTNNSPYAILVSHLYDETSITVRFFSTPWAQVETATSPRRDVVEGEVTDGFTVDYSRVITYPDGESQEESYTWTYDPNDGDDDDGEGGGDADD